MIKHASAISTLLAAAFVAAGLAGNTALAADAELDARAATTLEKFSKHEKSARAVVKNAGGVLVFSDLIKAAFLFGAEGGNGALQVGGKSVAYYTFAAASFGFQAGVQNKSLVVIFRDKSAVDKFQAADTFEVGVDANVAFFNKGRMIRWKQAGMGFQDFGLTYGNPDFVKYAESYGAAGHRVSSAEQLPALLREHLESPGVHLLEVPVDYSENERVLIDELREKTWNL